MHAMFALHLTYLTWAIPALLAMLVLGRWLVKRGVRKLRARQVGSQTFSTP